MAAGVAALVALVALAAFATATWSRAEFLGRPRAVAAALALVGALGLLRPLWGSYAALALFPLFGNHPSGRFMEALNVLLAASAAGHFALAALRRVPPPGGPLWWAAGAYVLSAMLALGPALDGMAGHWRALGELRLVVVEALTAPETERLYSLGSFALVLVAAGWAYALAWVAPPGFAVRALTVLAASFLGTTGLAGLEYHGVIDLGRYLEAIDPRGISPARFRAIFWNPGWFAWYFVMGFGCAVGAAVAAGARWRRAWGLGLGAAYVYSFANPQRGGLVALHAVVATAGALLFRRWRRPGRRTLMAVAAVAVTAGGVLLAGALGFGPVPADSVPGLRRLIDSFDTYDVRGYLAWTALRMWASAPLTGIGEAAYAWRFFDYATPKEAWGDAHSTWLQLLATRGLVGLGAWGWLLWAVARACARALGSGVRETRAVGVGVSAALAGFVVYSFVQYMFSLQAIQALFWVLVACLGLRSPAAPQPMERASRRVRLALGLATLALVTQAAWSGWTLVLVGPQTARRPPGFHGVEFPLEAPGHPSAPMRWSSRRGTVCVYPDPGAEVMTVQFGTGDPRVASRPVRITVTLDGHPADRFVVRTPGWTTRSYALSAARSALTPSSAAPDAGHARAPAIFGECLAAAAPVRLGVEVSRVWSPRSAGLGDDPRHLGVAVLAPEFGRVRRP